MPRGTVQSQQFALPADAELVMLRFDQTPQLVRRARQIFFSTSRPPFSGGRSAHTAPQQSLRHRRACVSADPRTVPLPDRSVASARPRPESDAPRTDWPTARGSCPPSPPPAPPWRETRLQTLVASVSSLGPPELQPIQ